MLILVLIPRILKTFWISGHHKKGNENVFFISHPIGVKLVSTSPLFMVGS